ncbi:hypothetical protein [Belliella aquatica]|uniref:Uncharacterized protein n=1 Tax=Belliella aquatica TaxID=1323734 RepID=A0ABQ1LKB6_9BACT|nr:hypothetical protein [Belliella aquatica]MCH7404167.1 hypothetical protein [Belliella aquatica]GGC25846.1 hypothetical protein GCM10010993_01170 [Belliella aquatica]
MKILAVVGILALTMSFGCTDKTEKVTKTEIRTEVQKEKEADTQIKIGTNGGSVKTKNVEVEIKNENN